MIVVKRPIGSTLVLRASNANPYPAKTVEPLNADVYWAYFDEPTNRKYLGTYPLDTRVRLPLPPDQDRDIIVSVVNRSGVGVQDESDVASATSLVVQSEREQRIPIVFQMGQALNDRIYVGVAHFSRHMRARRIIVATDSGFTNIVDTIYQDVDKSGSEMPRLPEQFVLSRAAGGAQATYFLKVAHSSFSTLLVASGTQLQKLAALRWGPESSTLSVTFPNAAVGGGSFNTYNPFDAITDQTGAGTFSIKAPLPVVSYDMRLMPQSASLYDLGAADFQWRDLFMSGAIKDGLGNELLAFTNVLSAINEYTFGNAASGSAPRLIATGGNTDIDAEIQPKGTGYLYVNNGRFKLHATGPTVVLVGTGSPESVVAAGPGSIYLRRDGGVGTVLYIKETGTGNTGWAAYAAGASGANTALSNLASVAINAALLPGTDNTLDLGSDVKRWQDLYLTGAIKDGNDVAFLGFTSDFLPVNSYTIGNAASGSGPRLIVTGSDTDAPAVIQPKGTAGVIIDGANPKLEFRRTSGADFLLDLLSGGIFSMRFISGSTLMSFTDSTGKVEITSAGFLHVTNLNIVTAIRDTNSQPVINISAGSSPINNLTISNAPSGGAPKISSTGGNSSIPIDFEPKGAASVRGYFSIGQGFIAQAISSGQSPLSGLANQSGQLNGEFGLALSAGHFSAAAGANDFVIRSGGAVAGNLIITAFNGGAIKFATAATTSDTVKQTIKPNGRWIGIAQNLQSKVAAAGNSGSTLTSLDSFSLPAGSLLTNGDYVHVRYSGFFATNDEDKQIVISFGGQTIHDPGLFDQDSGSWSYDIIYARVSDTVVAFSLNGAWNAIVVNDGTPSAIDGLTLGLGNTVTVASLTSNAMTILIQAKGTNTNDIVLVMSVIEMTQIA